jgi:hypothetical protein
MARNYIQGIFKPKNPEKYAGNAANIVFRSSWERKFMVFADENPQVLKWASEEIYIPYFSEVDQKIHRYFPDFIMQVRNNQGTIKKYMVEIKPEAQTLPPKKRSRTTKTYLNEMSTFSVNTSKWRAAEEWCRKNNMEFIIMTEKHLRT